MLYFIKPSVVVIPLSSSYESLKNHCVILGALVFTVRGGTLIYWLLFTTVLQGSRSELTFCIILLVTFEEVAVWRFLWNCTIGRALRLVSQCVVVYCTRHPVQLARLLWIIGVAVPGPAPVGPSVTATSLCLPDVTCSLKMSQRSVSVHILLCV